MPHTYRKLIQHVCDERIVHHTQQERSYRVLTYDLRHSLSLSDIAEELEKHGHKVRNIINIDDTESTNNLYQCSLLISSPIII